MKKNRISALLALTGQASPTEDAGITSLTNELAGKLHGGTLSANANCENSGCYNVGNDVCTNAFCTGTQDGSCTNGDCKP